MPRIICSLLAAYVFPGLLQESLKVMFNEPIFNPTTLRKKSMSCNMARMQGDFQGNMFQVLESNSKTCNIVARILHVSLKSSRCRPLPKQSSVNCKYVNSNFYFNFSLSNILLLGNISWSSYSEIQA